MADTDARPPWGSLRAMTWVIDNAPVSLELAWTLIVIARACDKDGKGSYQSIGRLAELTGKSPNQVRRDIGRLLKDGLIVPGDATLPIRNGVPAWKCPAVYDVALDRIGPKPSRDSKNPTGVKKDQIPPPMEGTPSPMDAPPTMHAHASPLDGSDPPTMHGEDPLPSKVANQDFDQDKETNPSLSPNDSRAHDGSTSEIERERDKDSEAPTVAEPAEPLPFVQRLAIKNGAPHEHADYVVEAIVIEHDVQNVRAFFVKADANGTLPELVTEALTPLYECEQAERPAPVPAPRSGARRRSTGALRAERALQVADDLDRENGHGRYANEVRSPADQRVVDNQRLYDKYRAREAAQRSGRRPSNRVQGTHDRPDGYYSIGINGEEEPVCATCGGGGGVYDHDVGETVNCTACDGYKHPKYR